MRRRPRAADPESKPPPGLKGLWARGQSAATYVAKQTIVLARWVHKKGGKTAWIVATTGLVVVLPLIMEIDRETQVIEAEKLQVKELLGQGYTPQEIAHMGLTSAVDPAVMGEAAAKA